MSKKNLPPIQRRTSVSFEIDNNENLNIDVLPPILDKFEKMDNRQFNIHVAVQTDPKWLDQLKKELTLSLQKELLDSQDQISSNIKSRPSTIRTQKSKVSSEKSKIQNQSPIREATELSLGFSEESMSSIPPYPEMKMDDEFGIALFNSSDDEDENFDTEKIEQLVDEQKEASPPVKSNENEQDNKINIIPDAGLPTILKVSKELGSVDLCPPLSADEFLLNALAPKDNEVCEFCSKPLKAMPNVKDQISNSVDQAQLFCCQEYRELVEFALAQNTNNYQNEKDSTTKLIDISPHKSMKGPEELAESRAKSERRIRERLLARQQAALQEAQAAKLRDDVPRRAHTEILNFATRQMRIINYQLSSYKFIEDGWTVSPKVLSNFEMAASKEISDEIIDVDYTKSIFDLFGQANLSEQCMAFGVIRQYYPDGKLFLILFQDGQASIYYPSGCLAISIVRPTADSSVICIIKDDVISSDSQAKVLSIINTNGFGSFSFPNQSPRIVFNTLLGTELLQNGFKKRQWFWNGEPHVHAPPFQPICFSINRYIGVRISSQKSINISFLGYTKHININVGCKLEIPIKIRKKMENMVKIETNRLQGPLNDIRNRVKGFIEKCNEALDHPFLVSKNKWPIKPYIMSKSSSENKTTISLSMM